MYALGVALETFGAGKGGPHLTRWSHPERMAKVGVRGLCTAKKKLTETTKLNCRPESGKPGAGKREKGVELEHAAGQSTARTCEKDGALFCAGSQAKDLPPPFPWPPTKSIDALRAPPTWTDGEYIRHILDGALSN